MESQVYTRCEVYCVGKKNLLPLWSLCCVDIGISEGKLEGDSNLEFDSVL